MRKSVPQHTMGTLKSELLRRNRQGLENLQQLSRVERFVPRQRICTFLQLVISVVEVTAIRRLLNRNCRLMQRSSTSINVIEVRCIDDVQETIITRNICRDREDNPTMNQHPLSYRLKLQQQICTYTGYADKVLFNLNKMPDFADIFLPLKSPIAEIKLKPITRQRK